MVISCPLCRWVLKPRNIVQIPDLPALAEVGDVLSAELGYQSLGEQLGRLAPLLKDESTEVGFFCWGRGEVGPLYNLSRIDGFQGSMGTGSVFVLLLKTGKFNASAKSAID